MLITTSSQLSPPEVSRSMLSIRGTCSPLLSDSSAPPNQLTVQRGWGRSVEQPKQRGFTGPTTRVLDDITSFLKTVIPCPIPLFLMGHSMGGGEVLLYMSTGPAELRKHIRGYLLESPFIDFDPKSKPSSVTVFLGRLAGKVLPHHQLTNPLDVKLITRNPTVQQQFTNDDLCHDTGTLQGLAGST